MIPSENPITGFIRLSGLSIGEHEKQRDLVVFPATSR